MPILRWASRIWTGVLVLAMLLVAALAVARLMLPQFGPRPALLNVAPGDDADVSTRARPVLRFTVPMNPRAVERALRVEPAVPATFAWDDQRTTLTISPTAALRPDTRYTVSVGAGATSRWFRAMLPTQSTFSTLPAPAVAAVLPADGATEVPTDAALSLRFTRAIVSDVALYQPATLPQLRFDPPVSGTLTWLDPATALFRPVASLRPATRYRATLDATLTDLNGEQLIAPFAWTFSTPAPALLATTPLDGAQNVAPRTPLTLRVAPPLDSRALDAGLVISPTITGVISATVLPDTTQIITFTPAASWQPATTYIAELRAGTSAQSGDLPLPRTARFFFQTAPPPRLVGRSPGEGQTLAPEQPISLIFTTPVDADALRAALRFTPPVSATQITVSDTEARITAALRAATPYTITIAPTLTDRNGVATEQPYQLRFVSAPATPALVFPNAQGHVLPLAPPVIAVDVRRTNVSQLALGLYRLDEATVVRAAAFNEGDWTSFDPTRYNQPLLRAWTLSLSDTLNTPIDARLALTQNDQPLDPGAYYLRVRTPEGPRADLLLLVSRAQLIFQRGSASGLLWATDVISGTPLRDLPLTLYRDGALIERGTTDARGLWAVGGFDVRTPSSEIVVAEGGGLSITSTQAPLLSNDVPPVRALLFTDQTSYRAGERVRVGAFTRAGSAVLPASARLVARSADASTRLAERTLPVTSTGVMSTSFVLPDDALPGEYVVTLTIGSTSVNARFAVQPLTVPPFRVEVATPERAVAGRATPITVTAMLSDGLPLAGALVTWTLDVLPAPPPALDGYRVGEDMPLVTFTPRTANGQIDANGRFVTLITDTTQLNERLQYRVTARVSEPGGDAVDATRTFVVQPAAVVVGARLPTQVAQAGQPQTLELLTATLDGQPAPGTNVRVVLFRRVDPRTTATDERVLERALTTGGDGRATLPFNLRVGGEYRFQSIASDADGRTTTTIVPLWVAADGFTDWVTSAPSRAALIPDQERYRPQDMATLLPTTPFALSSALLVTQQGNALTGTLQTIRAGETLTSTLPTNAEAARVAVWLVEQNTTQAAQTRFAVATLPIRVDPLTATLVADREAYAFGDTATLTLTTNVEADAVVGANGLRFLAAQSSGVLTFTVQLPPDVAAFPVQVWAADAAGRFAMAQTTLAITGALALDITLPSIVRVGDQPPLVARLTNNSVAPQSAQVTLTLTGAQADGALVRRVTLAPGATERLIWPLVVGAADVLIGSVRVQTDGSPPLSVVVRRAILLTGGTLTERSALVTERLSETIIISENARLVLELAPSVTALRREAARTLASQRDRSVSDEAALLRLSAPLTETRALARAALQRLAAAQRIDGGWAWWSSGPSDLFVTITVLDAVAMAQQFALDLPSGVIERGLRALDDPSFAATPTLRAGREYVRSRLERGGVAQDQLLSGDPQSLDATQVTWLLLANSNLDVQNALLDQLTGRAIRDRNGVYWPAAEGALYSTDISATAWAILAMQRVRPDAPLLPDARRWLVAQRGVGGWPSAYETALALDALPQTASPNDQRVTATLNGGTVFDSATSPLTATRQITLSTPLRPQNALVVTMDGGSLLLSYQVRSRSLTLDPRPLALSDGIGIVRDYLDPQTGQVLDPATLRVGQLVQVRLTLVAHRPLRYVTIAEPLLAAARLVAFRAGVFEHAAQRGDTLLLAHTQLPAGVYHYRYELRVVTPGQYTLRGAMVREVGQVRAVGQDQRTIATFDRAR